MIIFFFFFFKKSKIEIAADLFLIAENKRKTSGFVENLAVAE